MRIRCSKSATDSQANTACNRWRSPQSGSTAAETNREPSIEFILEILVTALWEGLFQFVFELMADAGNRLLRPPPKPRDRVHPVLTGLGVVLLGALAGLLVSLVFPERLITFGRIPGASLVLSPLFNAFAMEYYGRWRERRGRSRSFLATYWGGGLFAFGMASVRFLMTRGE